MIVADSAADVEAYISTVETVYTTTASTYARQLESQFATLDYLNAEIGDSAPIHDSRLEVEFLELSGDGGGVESNLEFTLNTQTRLYLPGESTPTYVRDYRFHTPVRRLSEWAEAEGAALYAAVDSLAANTVGAILDDHFRLSPYQMAADYPAFSYVFRPKRLDTTQPEFRWRVVEAEAPIDVVSGMSFELQISGDGGSYLLHEGIAVNHFVSEPLPLCETYEWLVRGHYESLGQPRRTAWSKPEKFRTPCPKS